MRTTDYERECIAHMHTNGITFDGNLKCDGGLYRFSKDSNKNQLDEWYVCHMWESSKGIQRLACTYGTWSGRQEKFTYKSYDANTEILSKVVDFRIK